MKAYREGAPGSGVANFPVLPETMPRLTPLPGHTPSAVNASAVFEAPNQPEKTVGTTKHTKDTKRKGG